MAGRDFKEQRQREYPNKPWMCEKEWENNQVKSSDKLTLIVVLVFCLIWNGISWAVVPEMIQQAKRGKEEAYIGLIFPFIGLMIAWILVKLWLRYRKFGRSILHLKTMPGVIGGAFEGEIIVPSVLAPEKGFEITLNCMKYKASTGSNNNSSKTILWQRSMVVKGEAIRTREPSTAIPVYMAIPFNQMGTQELDKRGSNIYWEIHVKAELPGADFGSHYVIPVYKTEESQEGFVPDERKIRDIMFDPDRSDTTVIADEGIVEDYQQGRWSMYFPAGRHKEGSFILFLFANAFTFGPFVFMHMTKTEFVMFPGLFIGFILGIFALVCWHIFLSKMFYRSEISVESGQVSLRYGMIKMTYRSFPVEQVKSVNIRRGMQTNSSLFYRIFIRTREGKPHSVAMQIPKLEIAESVEKRLKEQLKLS